MADSNVNVYMRLKILIWTALLALPCSAQELKIKSFEMVAADISASVHPRNDLNGEPCALVKVLITDGISRVEGNIIGSVEEHGTEKWIYMPAGTKMIRIIPQNFMPIQINFSSYGVKQLQGKMTYELKLTVPQYGNNGDLSILHGTEFDVGNLRFLIQDDDEVSVYSNVSLKGNFLNSTRDIGMTLKLPQKIEYKGWTFKVTAIQKQSSILDDKGLGIGAFSNSEDLQIVSIPEGIEVIDKNAFWCCKDLHTLKFPSTLTKIGSSAFFGCKSLSSLYIPKSVKIIGDNAFSYCNSLSNLEAEDGGNFIVIDSVLYDKAMTQCIAVSSEKKNLYVPSNLKLSKGCFSGLDKLQSAVFPENCIEVAQEMFEGCRNLQSVQLSANTKVIGGSAFRDCSLYQVTLPVTLTVIGYQAFQSCCFSSVFIPNSVNSIGDSAFRNCYWLEDISIPSSLLGKLPSNTFYGCSSLGKISIRYPNGKVEKIRKSSKKLYQRK